MNSIWQEFKLKFLKSGNPALLYVGINAIIFVVVSLITILFFYSGNRGVIENFVFDYFAFPASPELWISRFYTILTYQFIHFGFIHLLFNMLWLYWMGQLFLDFVKPRQFHFVYLGGGIMGAIFYALIANLIPVFANAGSLPLVGASASVMAIFTALVTLVPNYSIRMLFIGEVRIKYILFVYIFLDILGTTSIDFGGSLAHLGGVLFGFAYIKILQNGTDLTSIFKRKPKMKVVRNENQKKQEKVVNQNEIDAILDKISKSGYDQLSSKEKQVLFDASKN